MSKWKIIGISIAVVAIIVLSFVVSSKKENGMDEALSNDPETIINNAQRESSEVGDKVKEPTQIDVYDYLEFKEGNVEKIILVARPTCTYCQIAEPIINNIAYEYDIEINYLNTDNFTDETQTLFVQSDERFMSFGTPYLFILKDGSFIDDVDGLTDRAHYIDFFKRNGYIQ